VPDAVGRCHHAPGSVPTGQKPDLVVYSHENLAVTAGRQTSARQVALCDADQFAVGRPVPQAMVMGDPDVVLIFCTPAAADVMSRAYCYGFGEPISGFAGNGGCPFLIQYPFVTGKPSFSCSDVAWRKYIGLAAEELTMGFPFQILTRVCEDLPAIAHAYRHYGEPPEG